jgi:hypothetical protein
VPTVVPIKKRAVALHRQVAADIAEAISQEQQR